MKIVSILAISSYLLGCGDSHPLADNDPYNRWVGTWQGLIDDESSFHDWDTDYHYIFHATGNVEVRHRKSSDLLLIGVIAVTHDEFTLRLRHEEYGTSTVSGTWVITGEYLHLHYRWHARSRDDWRSVLKRVP